MKESKSSGLSERYLTALQNHFDQPPQTGLQAAHDLGDEAVTMGLETLDLAKIHAQALGVLVLPGCTGEKRDSLIRHATIFFTEANTPIEKTHRLALEAKADLNELQKTLKSRTQDLAESHRELQEGIAQREEAVRSLKSSEDQSARLLSESDQLRKHLQSMTYQILSAQESERKAMSLKLQDDIAQTLLAIHVRLLALKHEISASTADFQKEIAITQQLVQESVKTINHFAREFGISHED
jgi:signal transduction histidine kinase